MKTNTTGWKKVLEVAGDEGTLTIYRAAGNMHDQRLKPGIDMLKKKRSQGGQ